MINSFRSSELLKSALANEAEPVLQVSTASGGALHSSLHNDASASTCLTSAAAVAAAAAFDEISGALIPVRLAYLPTNWHHCLVLPSCIYLCHYRANADCNRQPLTLGLVVAT